MSDGGEGVRISVVMPGREPLSAFIPVALILERLPGVTVVTDQQAWLWVDENYDELAGMVQRRASGTALPSDDRRIRVRRRTRPWAATKPID